MSSIGADQHTRGRGKQMATYKNHTVTFNGVNYILRNQLGSGGNGCVWSATENSSSTEYAVKILTVDSGDDNYAEKRERFIKEITFCESVNHKNVLQVYAHGEYCGKPCYLMPRCQDTLRKVISKERDYIILLTYAIQLCEAVKYIHDIGVIHRDIKPENIFLDKESNIILADFGIAHFNDSSITQANDWLGNRSYASPEQLLRGNAQNVTSACDVYAVGMVINEMFTRKKPTGSKYTKVADVFPALLSLDPLLDRCMLQNPPERPTINAVLAQLKLLYYDIQDAIAAIWDCNPTTAKLSDTVAEKIYQKASTDILSAKSIFEQPSSELGNRVDCFYHQDIRYKLSAYLTSIYFQRGVFLACRNMFNHEAHVYSKGQQYTPLNLSKASEAKRYQQLVTVLERYKVDDAHDLRGQILKLFASCCDYHCDELLRSIPDHEQYISRFESAPLMNIIYLLKQVLLPEDIEEIDLIDHVLINWETTEYDENEQGSMFINDANTEIEQTLLQFSNRWNALCSMIDENHYSAVFSSREDYEAFKEYALALAKPHYVFEGDVLDIICIRREHEGIVELEPLNEWDITYVLAKIVGLKPIE